MGIRTHLLISLAGRLSSNRSVHQIQGASIDPFHAAPQSRTRLRWRLLDRRDLDIGIEAWSPRCTLEAMRASLLANATASLFLCNRSDAELSHGPKLYRAQLCGRIRRTLAAWISSVRRYLLPRLEMRPRIDRPPVLYCRGTSPNQAAKSRPRSKASSLPIAATMAVEISGPTPGTLINCRHLASDRLRISISPVTVSIRSSRQHQSS